MKRIQSQALVGLAGIALTLALAAPGCQSGAPMPTPADRVVLLSLDGLGADVLDTWRMDSSICSQQGLAGFFDHGVFADRVRMANPTLTAVNHATLITGASPGESGLVSNGYRALGRPVTERMNGFAAPLGAEPLWQRAREAGVRTGVLLWPGADDASEERRGDFGIAWPGRSIVRKKLYTLEKADAEIEPELPPQDGVSPHRWRLPVVMPDEKSITVEIAVLDTNPDGMARYDTVAYRLQGDVSYTYVQERQWFDITTLTTGPDDKKPKTYGSWSKVLHLDRHRGELKLYRGAFNRLFAYPEGFESTIVEAFGPWPGTPDERELAAWWLDSSNGIDLDTFVEQLERLDRYLDDIARWALTNESFGFLVSYHPGIDEFLHSSLIVDQDQWAWSEGRAFAAAKAHERVGRSADRAVAALWELLNPAEDVLVVVSDHGHLPIHDEVLVNQALADAGLVEVEEINGRTRIAQSTPMIAHTSGGCANVYLNLEGRDPGGVVKPEEAPDLLLRAAKALADLGVDGEPVVEKIAGERELRDLGLAHPNSGDLVVFLAPGYAASSRLNGEAIRPSRYYGQHGYLNHHPAMDGIFLARGGAAGTGRLRTMQATDVAPRVAGWLGLP